MKILLVSMSDIHPNTDHYYPLSLGYLSSVLRKDQHEVTVCNLFSIEWEEAKPILDTLLRTSRPDVVGFNCITMNRWATGEAVNLVKSYSKEIITVLGGVHATVMTEQLLENFPIDFIVKGEGELCFRDLLRTLDNRSEKIRESSVKVVLDELPMPDHSYAREWIARRKRAHVSASRGCPFKCIFCSTGAYWGQRVRVRNPELVVDEVEMLIKNYGAEDILFHDDTFNLTPNRCISISQELLRRRVKIKWQCVGRVVPVNKEMLILMKRSGCQMIMFGVESASERVLSKLEKGITREQIMKCFKLCEEVGIGSTAFMMVGLPGETDETIEETRAFMSQVPMSAYPNTGLTFVYPGTKLYDICKEQNLIDDSYWLREKNDFLFEVQAPKAKLHGWGGHISGAAKLYA